MIAGSPGSLARSPAPIERSASTNTSARARSAFRIAAAKASRTAVPWLGTSSARARPAAPPSCAALPWVTLPSTGLAGDFALSSPDGVTIQIAGALRRDGEPSRPAALLADRCNLRDRDLGQVD